MDSQIPVSSDRSRTYWTPIMERYFVDLMIEQMHRGNRIGHTFNKEAWIDMLAVFNAKFGSQYDKDVLKLRYTNLWRQFNDVKNLLGQNGFSWDETREMVIANDYAWDTYLKVHPEARTYKTKSVLNFSDLCLIYGYTSADGRYSRSSHDVDFDDEIQRVNMDGASSHVPLNKERSRTEWTPSMDQYFLELMLDQVGRGNKSGDTFTKQAWTDMLHLFNEKIGPQYGKRVLRHRYKKLWKYYSDATLLLQEDGFSWDKTRQMITADDDVWDAYIKVNPHARTYRTKVLPNYDDLVLIYGSACDNGTQSRLDQQKNPEDDNTGRKSVDKSCTGDRTRTYWTPPMDRHLIDLLLDQTLRGNKLGQTFITQAWTVMVAHFNANFQSNYEKDVLKNRYKYLRKQFNEIRNILKQDGFSWDESKEMITADDRLWDAYIKEHPDARSYRVRTVPSYHKLCVIFGERSSDARYNRVADSIDPSCEISVLMAGDELNHLYSPRNESSVVEWTEQMDRYFTDLLIEIGHGGNKNGSTLDDVAWVRMITSFNKRFGLQCGRSDLESRYMFLMKQHDDISKLLSHGGFAWDEMQQMLIADGEVWEAYMKVDPDACVYRDKVLCCYDSSHKIYSNMVEGNFISEDPGTCIHDAQNLEGDAGCTDAQSPSADYHISHPLRKRPGTPSHENGPASKLQRTEEMQGVLSGNNNEGATVDELPVSVNWREPKSYTIEGAISALQEIPDIDDDILLDACDLLEEERKARTFLALDAPLRKKWLLRKLRP
ncbi:L10-interacting MYB domain-containing protein isoform X3 [Rhodamnia argentea]|uniref:L10-interacting MYB domain-containing protein isoform X3 n=1 Tax=Rhodamnia argentea TaxID=178133 RepID=A0A8B8QBH0_9MYRT|nr:L10-interacting MYB domain-containing protein isoform X3 [Rhodamnia argentea]